jgi:hypothetical protein
VARLLLVLRTVVAAETWLDRAKRAACPDLEAMVRRQFAVGEMESIDRVAGGLVVEHIAGATWARALQRERRAAG